MIEEELYVTSKTIGAGHVIKEERRTKRTITVTITLSDCEELKSFRDAMVGWDNDIVAYLEDYASECIGEDNE